MSSEHPLYASATFYKPFGIAPYLQIPLSETGSLETPSSSGGVSDEPSAINCAAEIRGYSRPNGPLCTPFTRRDRYSSRSTIRHIHSASEDRHPARRGRAVRSPQGAPSRLTRRFAEENIATRAVTAGTIDNGSQRGGNAQQQRI
jgi:hypothetical protein